MSNHPTAKSWFDRASETVKGVLLGVALFCSSFLLLFFNEGSAVQALQGLNGGAGSALSISTDRINPAHEGALVHFSGTATPDMPLTDDTFGITTTALRLDRTVEMFQWQERESGYVKGWSTSVVDSSAFKVRKNHRNPTTLPLASTSVAANRVTVGAFTLPASLTERITQTEVLPVDGLKLRKNVRAYGSSLYLGADPINPQIGDVRVQFSVVKPAVVSVVARQAGATLEPYPTQSGAMVEVLLPGTVAAPAMFQAAQDANVLATWFLRLLGFLMMAAGITLVQRPFEALLDVIPVLGSLMGYGLRLVAAAVAGPLSAFTMALNWVTFRPLVGLLLMIIAVGGAVGLSVVANQKRAQPILVKTPLPAFTMRHESDASPARPDASRPLFGGYGAQQSATH